MRASSEISPRRRFAAYVTLAVGSLALFNVSKFNDVVTNIWGRWQSGDHTVYCDDTSTHQEIISDGNGWTSIVAQVDPTGRFGHEALISELQRLGHVDDVMPPFGTKVVVPDHPEKCHQG